MAINILGRKLGMLQFFDKDGNAVGVTVLEAGPCVVTQVKTQDQDGYDAIQLAFAEKAERTVTKPMLGHFKKAGVSPKRVLRESRVDDPSAYSVGQEIRVDELFKPGDIVDIKGISKGRGFAGGIRRHKFHRSPESHGGQIQRQHGSTGQSAAIAHVLKGMKMPGHMGAANVTVHNVRIVEVRAEHNQLLLEGAVPGPTNAIVTVRSAIKKRTTEIAGG